MGGGGNPPPPLGQIGLNNSKKYNNNATTTTAAQQQLLQQKRTTRATSIYFSPIKGREYILIAFPRTSLFTIQKFRKQIQVHRLTDS